MTTNKIKSMMEKDPWFKERINTAIWDVANKWKEWYNDWLADKLYDYIKEDINQCIDVADQKDIATKLVNDLISRYEIDASDWYHTFNELYKHRIHLFIAFCKALYEQEYHPSNPKIIKSKKHFDWSEFEWWFIVQLETSVWQISYHLPNEYWDTCSFIDTLDKANEWDWHDSNTVLKRLLLI